MLVGYVSDERYVALPDVLLEFESAAGSSRRPLAGDRLGPRFNLPPGTYRVTLQKAGFRGEVRDAWRSAPGTPPHHFRLLSDGLLGYAWPKWVRSGEKSEFRVHSVEPYKLDLWRYGCEKEFVRNLGWFDEHGPRATMQITPDGDYTQTGVEWNKYGYANPHHKQYVEAPGAVGPVLLPRQDGRGARRSRSPGSSPRPSPTAPIAVLASNITWNAYNNFGGRSNYINADRLPADADRQRPAGTEALHRPGRRHLRHRRLRPALVRPARADQPHRRARADHRPDRGPAACHLAPAEWRLLGWLEREGFAYDYYAETQLHDGTLDLDAYQVLVISARTPSTGRARCTSAVKRWVFERGGRLHVPGRQRPELRGRVRRPDGTVIYRNGDAPGGEARAASRAGSTCGVESEANLLGVVFTDDRGHDRGARTAWSTPAHWVFAGTGLKNGDLFGEKSLHMRCPGGASGHETDKVSPSSPPDIARLAKGTEPRRRRRRAGCYETSSGGAVFSAGSITWPSSILVDDCVSRITANVLRRYLD